MTISPAARPWKNAWPGIQPQETGARRPALGRGYGDACRARLAAAEGQPGRPRLLQRHRAKLAGSHVLRRLLGGGRALVHESGYGVRSGSGGAEVVPAPLPQLIADYAKPEGR